LTLIFFLIIHLFLSAYFRFFSDPPFCLLSLIFFRIFRLPFVPYFVSYPSFGFQSHVDQTKIVAEVNQMNGGDG
jgi:Na+-driven multidrug efflux pump